MINTDKKKAVVFGKGKYYLSKKRSYAEEYTIIGFIDSSLKQDEEFIFESKKVVNPIRVTEFDAECILLSSVNFLDMWMTLKKYNIKDEYIRAGVDFYPYYNEFERMLHEEGATVKFECNKIILTCSGVSDIIESKKDFQSFIRKLYLDKKPEISIIKKLPCVPVSRSFGSEHGTPIDRYYIENFIKKFSEHIRGEVFEVANDNYTRKYGADVVESRIIHVNGWGENAIRMNLETGEGVLENVADCFICTQTMQMIFDLESCVKNIYKLLKPRGCALITVHGMSQISAYDYRNWGEYWRFTPMCMKKLLTETFGNENVEVESFGNVKVLTAFLYGLTIEDMELEDFEYNDDQVPFLVTAFVMK